MARVVSLCLIAALASAPAYGALETGAAAPGFEAEAAKAGEQFTFKLEDALMQGPVVVYFYPAANTPGCDREAHGFSEASAEFKSYNATIVGVSADDIETLITYSGNPETCAGNLAVASDADGEIMRAYDAVASENPANAAYADRLEGRADRVTFVIAPNGEIIFTYSDLRGPDSHVNGSLEAVKTWAAAQAAQN
jgi:peroxiredoxin